MSGTPKKSSSSSPYQVLGNRPIDQWKVTELKEELKKRKLITRGLKDDLVKRLDEALRIERDNVAALGEPGVGSDDVVTPEKGVGESGKGFETPKTNEVIKVDRIVDDWVKVDAFEGQIVTGVLNEEAAGVASGMVSGNEDVVVVQKTVVETITKSVVTETFTSDQEILTDIENSEAQNENSKSEIVTENFQGSEPQKESEKPLEVGSVDSSTKLPRFEDRVEGTVKTIEAPDQVTASGQEDATSPANQVSEVSPPLGLEVKFGSISSDSVTIVEKNELKDNVIADNVEFELNVKPEMVLPSSVNVAPDVGGSQPIDVEDPIEKKLSADVNDENASCVAKTDTDMEYPEKLNLDRSSGDDSMDEDVFDNKQIDTKTTSSVFEDKNEQVEIKDEIIVDVISEGKDDSHVEDKGVVAAEKRKLIGHSSTGNNEPVKRQRRWNTDSVNVAGLQITASAVSTTPRESISPAVGRHGLLRPNSTNSSENATKERVVPPSANPPTNSLRIDRFVRPFTLKAVQELLGKTGKVVSFWMDQIKTHCYVTYSSTEEATETRNAVYNLQWPTNGGRLLIADFVDPQEVKHRVELPNSSHAALISAPPPHDAEPAKQPQPSPHQVQRQQPPLQTSFPPPPQLSVPPPHPEKPEPPIVTLDDLFRKTTTLPRIYYLPLSEEHVAEKLAAREKNIKT